MPFNLMSRTGSNLKLSSPTLAWNDKLQVSARVTNTGKREGVHVVQLYTRDRVASRTRPVRELKRFLRVSLKPGESRDITFELERGSLTFFGEGDRWTAEPGVFDVWVASSAVDGLNAQFTLLGA